MSKAIEDLEDFVLEEDEPEIKCGEFQKYQTSEEFFPCNEDQFCDVEQQKCRNKSESVDPSYKRYALDANKALIFLGKTPALSGLGKKYKEIKTREFDEKDKERLDRIRQQQIIESKEREAEEAAKILKAQQEEEIKQQIIEEARAKEIQKQFDLQEQQEKEKARIERVKIEVEEGKIEKEVEIAEQVEAILKESIKEAEKEEKKYINKSLTRTRLTGFVFHTVQRLIDQAKQEGEDAVVEPEFIYENLWKKINFDTPIKKETKTVEIIDKLIKKYLGSTTKKRVSYLTNFPDLVIDIDVEIDLPIEEVKQIEKKADISLEKTKKEVTVRIQGEDVDIDRNKLRSLIAKLSVDCEFDIPKAFKKPRLMEINDEYKLGILEPETKPKKKFGKTQELCKEVLIRLQELESRLPVMEETIEEKTKEVKKFNGTWQDLKKVVREIEENCKNIEKRKLKDIVDTYDLTVSITKNITTQKICENIIDQLTKKYRALRKATKEVLVEKEEELKQIIGDKAIQLEPTEEDKDRIRSERIEIERIQAEQAERERVQREQAEQAERERVQREQAEQAERERVQKEKEEALKRPSKKEREEQIRKSEIEDVINQAVNKIKSLRSKGRMEFELYKLPKTVAVCTGLSV